MKTTVAIADDHALMRNALNELLSTNFDVTITAFDGRDLLDKIKLSGDIPDLAIIAVSMPVLNGFDTAKELRRLYPLIKILAFSMNGEQSVIDKMIANGADRYVLKGDILTLLTTLTEWSAEKSNH